MRTGLRTAKIVVPCLLAFGSAPALVHAEQGTAETLRSLDAALATSVTHEIVREFTFCELRAAAWGRYDIAVRVGKTATQDGQPRIFQITNGTFSQKADPNTGVELARVEGRGDVDFANKEAAFAEGVPFFISDAALASPTELNYTVHSNPAVPLERAFFMMETRVETTLYGTDLEVGKPLSSSAEPQARTHRLSYSLDPTHKYRFEIVTKLGDHQGCLVSNTIDLNEFLKAAP